MKFVLARFLRSREVSKASKCHERDENQRCGLLSVQPILGGVALSVGRSGPAQRRR